MISGFNFNIQQVWQHKVTCVKNSSKFLNKKTKNA